MNERSISREPTGMAVGDVDLILYVRRLPGRIDHYEAQMYSQATLLAGFDENRALAWTSLSCPVC
jgi:hypothetical protein